MCAAGGTRAAPDKEQVAQFVQNARTLDPELVGPSLLELLFEDGPWQGKSKALVVIAELVKADGCEPYADYFRENAADIEPLCATKPAAVSNKAATTSSVRLLSPRYANHPNAASHTPRNRAIPM